jgi:predicted nucleic acid-binding protein
MRNIVIDTNPLVYIYNGVPGFGEKYADLLYELSRKNILVIPKIVYGELSLIFRNDQELDDFLRDTGIVIVEMEKELYLVAAKRWSKYNERRILMCSSCGRKLERLTCTGCKAEIRVRQHILTDFLIGACALHFEGRIIVTSDAGYYSTYFPELDIISIAARVP